MMDKERDAHTRKIKNKRIGAAEKYLVKKNLEYRIVREDGFSYAVTDDYKPDRVNIQIISGMVSEVEWG